MLFMSNCFHPQETCARQQRAYHTLNQNFIDGEFDRRVSAAMPDELRSLEQALRTEFDNCMQEAFALLTQGAERSHAHAELIAAQETPSPFAKASVYGDLLLRIEAEGKRMLDPLTKLPKRDTALLFFDHVLAKLDRALQDKNSVNTGDLHIGVIILDIDNFKSVNDEHGHTAGDKVLQEVAVRLEKAARHSDLVARWGGEEFVVILNGTDSVEHAMQTAERLRTAVCATPVVIDSRGSTLDISASFGVTIRPVDQHTLENASMLNTAMLQEADTALYTAKNTGRNRTVFYDASNAQRV